jgi:chitosanase
MTRRAWLILLCTTLLAVAGCGSSGNLSAGPGPAGTGGTGASPAATGSPSGAGPGPTGGGSTAPLPSAQAPSAVTTPARVPATAAARPVPPVNQPAPDLTDPRKKDIAMQLVSSAENSSLNWKAQYRYIQDIGDGRGYTAGIIGFCSGTGDMLDLVTRYAGRVPGNVLAKYLPALRKVDGSDSHAGLDPTFAADWVAAAGDPAFQQEQNDERDRMYFNPAVSQAKADGLRALGQFIYYDAIVMHGPGNDPVSFGGIRAAAMRHAKTPAQGGDERTYLNAFLDARKAAMLTEAAHEDTSRVDTEQRVFLGNGNFDLNTPLTWKTYGDSYTIAG